MPEKALASYCAFHNQPWLCHSSGLIIGRKIHTEMHLKKFYHKERLFGFSYPLHARSENDMEIDFFVLYLEPIYSFCTWQMFPFPKIKFPTETHLINTFHTVQY